MLLLLEIALTTTSSDNNTAAITAINDNFYKEGSRFVIPILLEKPESSTLGNTITAYDVSYLVISPKCRTPIKPSGNDVDYSVSNGTSIYGETTTLPDDSTESLDQINFKALIEPNAIPS